MEDEVKGGGGGEEIKFDGGAQCFSTYARSLSLCIPSGADSSKDGGGARCNQESPAAGFNY